LRQLIFGGIPEVDWIQVRDGYNAKFSARPEATLVDIFWNYCQWFKDLSGFGPRVERSISVGEWDYVLKIHIEISRGPMLQELAIVKEAPREPITMDDDSRYDVDRIGGVSEIMVAGEQVKPDEDIESTFLEPLTLISRRMKMMMTPRRPSRRTQPISRRESWALGGVYIEGLEGRESRTGP